MTLQKLASVLIIFIMLINPVNLLAADGESSSGLMSNSLEDLTLVLGAGLGGAVLGLSTLSFVDNPSDHFKNVAVGGAIGIVLGVSVVVFSQASRSSFSSVKQPINEFNFASVKRENFLEDNLSRKILPTPDFSYKITF